VFLKKKQVKIIEFKKKSLSYEFGKTLDLIEGFKVKKICSLIETISKIIKYVREFSNRLNESRNIISNAKYDDDCKNMKEHERTIIYLKTK
jgi:hypothetical protein